MTNYRELIKRTSEIINFSGVSENLDSIKYAILNKRPITFEYKKPSGNISIRYGYPYVLYRYPKKSGRTTYYVYMMDLVQTKGESESLNFPPDKPTFRRFRINRVSKVKVNKRGRSFNPNHKHYNSEWIKYRNNIAKV